MNLHSLPKTTSKTKKRLGRGYGSGVGGHTSSRGQKGQKARSKVKIWFEGGQLPLTKKLPFLRGKDRFKKLRPTPVLINLHQLNVFPANTEITKHFLVKQGLVDLKEASERSIKILGKGTISVALNITDLSVSELAAQKIKDAGGTISLQ